MRRPVATERMSRQGEACLALFQHAAADGGRPMGRPYEGGVCVGARHCLVLFPHAAADGGRPLAPPCEGFVFVGEGRLPRPLSAWGGGWRATHGSPLRRVCLRRGEALPRPVSACGGGWRAPPGSPVRRVCLRGGGALASPSFSMGRRMEGDPWVAPTKGVSA